MRRLFKKILVASIAAGSFIFVPQFNGVENISAVQAKIKTYTGVGKCVQGDLITIAKAKEYAKIRAEINAKDQAGVYISSYSKMNNIGLTENKIEVISNSIVNFVGEVQYTQQPFDLGGVPAVVHNATLQANIDTDGLNAYIRRDDGEKTKSELQSATKDIKTDLNKIDTLIEQYSKSSSQTEQDKIRQEFNQAESKVLANQKLDEGNKFYIQGNYQEAIRLYREAVSINPNSYETYVNLGNAYYYLQQYDAAVSEYTNAINLNLLSRALDKGLAYNNRGNLYYDSGQYEKAISDYSRAISDYEWQAQNDMLANRTGLNFDKASMAYCNRADAYLKLKKYDMALADYDNCMNVPHVINKSIRVKAFNGRGKVYQALENYSEAISNFNMAIERDPNYGTSYFNRGLCYQALGNKKKANADFAKAKQLGYNG